MSIADLVQDRITDVLRRARAIEDVRLCAAMLGMERADWGSLHFVEPDDPFGVEPCGDSYTIYATPANVACWWPRGMVPE